MKLKHLFFALTATVCFTTAQAQVKIGTNPSAISTNSVLDVEGTSGQHTVILQNGNMGVNKTAPAGKLHVTGTNDDVLYLEGLGTVTGPYRAMGVNNTTGKVGTYTAGSSPVFVLRNSYDSYGTANRVFVEMAGSVTSTITVNTLGASVTNDPTNGDYITLPEVGIYRIDVQAVANSARTAGGVGANIGATGQANSGTITDLLSSYAAQFASGNNYPLFATKIVETPSAGYRLRLYIEATPGAVVNPGCSGSGQDYCMQLIITKL